MTTITHTWEERTPPNSFLSDWWHEVDRYSIIAVVFLFCIGIVLSFSATIPLAEKNDLSPFYYFARHIVFALIGMTALLSISFLKPKQALRIGCWVFCISFILLVLLPFIGTGYDKGSIRWLSLGFASIQPSEFIKPALIVFSAWLFRFTFENKTNFGIYLSLALTIVCCSILVLQPDFGQAGLVFIGWCVIYFTAGAPISLLAVIGTFFLVAVYLAYTFSFHFASRINAFIDTLFGTTSSYDQVSISTEAFRNGKWWGEGPNEGLYKWRLPDGHTDFIIAIAAEEFGFFFVAIIILLYIFIGYRTILRLFKSQDNFICLAGAGLIINFILQAFINLAVAAKLFPPTGMTLPLISYGGSSMLAIGITLGLLFCFTRIQADGERKIYFH